MLRRVALFLMVTVAACGGDSSGPRPVASVSISPPAPTVQVGATVQLTATPRDAAGTALSGRTVEWRSDNTSIATVDGAGAVLGVSAGTTQIHATIEGRSTSVTVTVTPPPVASIQLQPPAPSVVVGGSIGLIATARDAGGNVISGVTITYTSSNNNVATVDGQGIVRGVSVGTARITASADGRSTFVDVTVTSTGASVVLTGVSPGALTEGGTATLTGSGFGSTPAANTVTVDGVSAQITAASPTSLQIVLPVGQCLPARRAEFVVSTGGVASNPVRHPVQPASTLSMAIGEFKLVRNPSDFCLQFGQGVNGLFVMGVLSTAESPNSFTPVRVEGNVATGAAALAPTPWELPPANVAERPSGATTLADVVRGARIARHHEAELALRSRQLAELQRLLPLAPRDRGVNARGIPSNVAVGDTVDLRFPPREGLLCPTFTPFRAIVRHIGQRGVWVEDIANPPGGFTAAEYAAASDALDTRIYAVNTQYFGEPSDFDGNTRVVIVLTQQVNKVSGLLGTVYGSDLAARADCPSSNEGEFYYGRTPDPSGVAGDIYTKTDALADLPPLIAHELAHIIQFGRRILHTDGIGPLQTLWELESQATLAEEVVGHAFTGRAPRQNYGFAIAFNTPTNDDNDWYSNKFVDLALYYGFRSQTDKQPGAPEQCSWLGRPPDNTSPCINARLVYTGWAFLRWLSDHYGPSFPGGEAGMHRAFIANDEQGFDNIVDVVGVPIDSLLAMFGATLYTDDRFSTVPALLTMPSWNLTGIFTNLVETARLQPYLRSIGTPFSNDVTVNGASNAYFQLSAGGTPAATAVRVRSQTGTTLPGTMRLWIVRVQ